MTPDYRGGTTVSEQPGTVARALSVLTVVAQAKESLGVKDVANALQLPMSTSHRLLDLLCESGFVERDSARRRYKVGLAFQRLAILVGQKVTETDLIQPVLDKITSETGETSIYSTYLPAQRAIMYAAKSDSPHSLRFRVERFQPMPIEWGASGLAVLAYLSPEIQADLQKAATPSPLDRKRLSRAAFFERIEAVRRKGFAVSEGEKLADSFGIGVPIMTADGQVSGSITLTIPRVRFVRSNLKDYAALLKREANRFSNRND
jgi:DNA-binding IclR family transcriptional regulator